MVFWILSWRRLLLAGRKLFWLFVGGIGFVIGIQVATRFFHGSELTTIVAGLVLGIIFALLAIFVESAHIGVAGFLGGGYVLLSLIALFGIDKGAVTWIAFIIGGLIGLALIAFFIRLGANHYFITGGGVLGCMGM